MEQITLDTPELTNGEEHNERQKKKDAPEEEPTEGEEANEKVEKNGNGKKQNWKRKGTFVAYTSPRRPRKTTIDMRKSYKK